MEMDGLQGGALSYRMCLALLRIASQGLISMRRDVGLSPGAGCFC